MTPIGADAVPAFRGKRRKRNRYLASIGATYSTAEKFRALQTRYVEMQRAQEAWNAMPAWKRWVLENLLDADPVSYFLERGE